MREGSQALRAFLLTVGALFLLRLFFGFVAFPVSMVKALSILNAALFVGLPIYAMFRAGEFPWGQPSQEGEGRAKYGLMFLSIGVILHVGGAVLARYVAGPSSPAEVLFMAIVQTGILFWTLGIGALLSLVVSDKNLMIPIAVFLVGFDMFLVFSPDSPTQRLLASSPAVTQNVLASVPQPKAHGQAKAGVLDLARVGPADLLFAATFFILLFRFRMNARKTLIWLVPVLVAYLCVVIWASDVSIGPLSLSMLPAMVPIGLVVLIVNWREFRLQGQELVGVALVVVIASGFAAYGLYKAKQASQHRPARPTETLQPGGAQPALRSEGSP